MTDDPRPTLGYCTCGHPGAGCYCYSARRAKHVAEVRAWTARQASKPTPVAKPKIRSAPIPKAQPTIETLALGGAARSHDRAPWEDQAASKPSPFLKAEPAIEPAWMLEKLPPEAMYPEPLACDCGPCRRLRDPDEWVEATRRNDTADLVDATSSGGMITRTEPTKPADRDSERPGARSVTDDTPEEAWSDYAESYEPIPDEVYWETETAGRRVPHVSEESARDYLSRNYGELIRVAIIRKRVK